MNMPNFKSMQSYAGRNKWHMAAGFSDNAPAAIPPSPEAVETARRAYSAGAAAQYVSWVFSSARPCVAC